VLAEIEEPAWEKGKRAPAGRHPYGQAVVELPPGLVERGALRTVERGEEWAALLEGPHGDALAMLGAPAPDRRLVLVGKIAGMNCDTLTLQVDDNAYRVVPEIRPESGESAGGCALVVPRDHREVRFVKPR
jgi:hypothetical protein